MRLALLSCFVSGASQALAASFDCSKKLSACEKLICGDPKTSKLDEELAALYQEALAKTSQPDLLKLEQQRWIVKRNKSPSRLSVLSAYLKRVAELRFHCERAHATSLEKRICESADERGLERALSELIPAWKAAASKHPRAKKLLDVPLTKLENPSPLLREWIQDCLTQSCKQARTAVAVAEYVFPSEIYEKFLSWVKTEQCEKSPLFGEKEWKLQESIGTAVFCLAADGTIYHFGFTKPRWLQSGSSIDEFVDKPPFFERPFTVHERMNLSRLMESSWSIQSGGQKPEGIPDFLLQEDGKSIRIENGSGAKCSPDPRSTAITIWEQFPLPAGQNNFSLKRSSYAIVRFLDAPATMPKPKCAFEYPEPDEVQFFQPMTHLEISLFDSRVRPDGMIWLQLSDGNWYRFRRNLTSEAPEIGTIYHIIPRADFDRALSESKNVAEWEAKLRAQVKAK